MRGDAFSSRPSKPLFLHPPCSKLVLAAAGAKIDDAPVERREKTSKKDQTLVARSQRSLSPSVDGGWKPIKEGGRHPAIYGRPAKLILRRQKLLLREVVAASIFLLSLSPLSSIRLRVSRFLRATPYQGRDSFSLGSFATNPPPGCSTKLHTALQAKSRPSVTRELNSRLCPPPLRQLLLLS